MTENAGGETAPRARRALILIGASIVLAVTLILVFGGTALAPTPSAAPTSRPGVAPSLTFSAGPAGYLTVIVSNPPDGAIEVDAACVTSAGANFEAAAAAARDGGQAQASLRLVEVPLTCTVTASADSDGKPVVFASAVFERN